MPTQIEPEHNIDENLCEMRSDSGSQSDGMEVEPAQPLMSLDDIDLTSTPDSVQPTTENHDISIEPFEPEPLNEEPITENDDFSNKPFEPEPEPISNEIIATQNEKDLELDTHQNVSETVIPTAAVPKEILEKLEHGHEKVETLGYIDASALQVAKTASKMPLDIVCDDEIMPDLDADSFNEATNDDFAMNTSVQESGPIDSNESINVIRDDHDYLNWSQKSTWPVIQNGT